ncbi:GNAT family N-acetyltransferase [uncultured Cohaesibacter sp.]|uniref:GNAT family N-acetyltransferase n=1 Tax=uncultured Cohaesibacter sp. TaxID=1002546 RepID=UPI00292F024E|nr:GNAT family N-acetyltransferase [uncultured Cohaesibacter sp.]
MPLTIRPASLEDMQDIFDWRNDALSRAMFKDSGTVSWDNHVTWFQKKLQSSDSQLFMALENNQKIGIVRFDANQEQNGFEVSINLNPECRGKKLSCPALDAAIEEFAKIHPDRLTATVKHSNPPSLKLFAKCGFKQTSSDHEFVYLYRDIEI